MNNLGVLGQIQPKANSNKNAHIRICAAPGGSRLIEHKARMAFSQWTQEIHPTQLIAQRRIQSLSSPRRPPRSRRLITKSSLTLDASLLFWVLGLENFDQTVRVPQSKNKKIKNKSYSCLHNDLPQNMDLYFRRVSIKSCMLILL